MDTAGEIFLTTCALGCFFLFRAYLKPLNSEIKHRDGRALAGGILLFSLAGFWLFNSFHGVPRNPAYLAILFRLIEGIVVGMLVTTLMSIGWRQGAKRILVISCIWFMVSNLILVGICFHVTGHMISLGLLSRLPATYGIEANPFGMAIAAVVILGSVVNNPKNLTTSTVGSQQPNLLLKMEPRGLDACCAWA